MKNKTTNPKNTFHHVEKGSGCESRLSTEGWNLLQEEVSFPIAVVKQSALENNAKWMQSFSEQAGVLLAPHGKTTMSPDLFALQLEHGCWGLSLASVVQVKNAVVSGVSRIILANQLVGNYHMALIADLLRNSALEFYCFVDSVENARALGEFFTLRNIELNILLEIGVENGRCGWRDINNVDVIVDEIHKHTSLKLCGVSFYEGVIHGENAQEDIIKFVQAISRLVLTLQSQNKFANQDIIITGAGSAWYDIVAKEIVVSLGENHQNIVPIIRPGCYLIHDTGIYQQAQNNVVQRSQLAYDIAGELVSSLTVWAYVLSIPEPNLAIIGLGKRDVAFDAGLPSPEVIFRPGTAAPQALSDECIVTKVMDQHAMLRFCNSTCIQQGDIICFSTSHPCLTFDKWRQVGLMDDSFVVRNVIKTYF